MPTTQLQFGQVEAMVQSTIYALPMSRALLFTTDTTATVQQSNTLSFAASVPVVVTTGQAEVAGGFIRCTTGAINVMLKRM